MIIWAIAGYILPYVLLVGYLIMRIVFCMESVPVPEPLFILVSIAAPVVALVFGAFHAEK